MKGGINGVYLICCFGDQAYWLSVGEKLDRSWKALSGMTQWVNDSQRVTLERDGDKFVRWCQRWKMKVVASTDYRSVLQVT